MAGHNFRSRLHRGFAAVAAASLIFTLGMTTVARAAEEITTETPAPPDTTPPADTPPVDAPPVEETPPPDTTPPADTPPAEVPPAAGTPDAPPADELPAESLGVESESEYCERTGDETVATDAPDYAPESIVHVTGTGYGHSCDVIVRVTRPDGSVVVGDGSFAPGSDTVTTSGSGALTYDYQLDGVTGLYTLDVLGIEPIDPDAEAPATADAVLATMTFYDSSCVEIQAVQNGTTCEYQTNQTIAADLTATLDPGLSLQVNTGVTVTLNAGVDFNITTPADAANGIVLQAGSAITGVATGDATTVTLNALGGTVTVNGQITTNDTTAGGGCGSAITLSSSGAFTTSVASVISTTASTICPGGTVSITSGGATTLNGTINTSSTGTGPRSGGNVTVNSSGALSIPGTVNANGAITNGCAAGTGGTVNLTGSSVTVGGSVTSEGTGGGNVGCAGGPITITTGGAATINGTVSTQTNRIGVSGGALTINAGGAVSVGAAGIVRASSTAAGTCGSASGGAIQITGASLNAAAGSTIASTGGSCGGGAITITMSGNVQLDGLVDASTAGTGQAGGTITIDAGGAIAMGGAAIVRSDQNAGSCTGATGGGGDISFVAGTSVTIPTGAQVTANGRCPGGAISISAPNGAIVIDGLVQSRSLLSGTGGIQSPGGGPITAIAGCALSVGGTVSSEGQDPGADLVHLEGCDVTITGTVRSTGAGHALPNFPANHCNTAGHPAGSTACVEVIAHGNLTITGTVHADLTAGASRRSWIDLISRGALSITGGAAFAVHANNGGDSPTGGQITVLSALGGVNLSGNAVQGNANGPNGAGGKGGSVTIGAGGTNVTLGTSVVQAAGNTGGGGSQGGGQISVRSYNGTVTGGPAPGALNAGGGTPPNGTVTLQACTAAPTYTGTVTPSPFINPGNQCGGAPSSDLAPCSGCVGSLTVDKVVVGDAGEGTEFTIEVVCPSRPEFNTTFTFDADGDLIPPPATTTISNIPAGTQCTVTETEDGDADSVTYSPDPPTVTITQGPTPVTVTVTNTYVGSLLVDKVVVGDAPAGTGFTINVSCPAASIDVDLTFNAAGDLDPAGQTNPITGIPVGTECTVDETGQGGADSVTYSPDPPTVTITNGETPVTVTVTNTYVGSLLVDKVVVGDAPVGTGFTINVSCPAASIDVDLTFNAAGDLDPAGQTNPITGIPVGTECTVDETGQGGADSVTYSPDPPTVTITNSETPVTVTVTNTFFGAITVNKIIAPSDGTPSIGDEYEVHVQCVDAGNNPIFDETFNLVFDTVMSHTFDDIPLPATCTVEEIALPPTASLVSYVPNGGTPTTPPSIPLGDEVSSASVEITNQYTSIGDEFTGSVNVAKAVVGGPPAEGTQFVINVSCVGPTVNVNEDITLVYSSQLTGNVSFSAPSVETVQCTVTEKDPLGGAVKASVSPNGGVVTLTVTAPSADVVVTNEYGEPPVIFGGSSTALPLTGSATHVLLKTAIWLLVLGTIALLLVRSRRRHRTLGV